MHRCSGRRSPPTFECASGSSLGFSKRSLGQPKVREEIAQLLLSTSVEQTLRHEAAFGPLEFDQLRPANRYVFARQAAQHDDLRVLLRQKSADGSAVLRTRGVIFESFADLGVRMRN